MALNDIYQIAVDFQLYDVVGTNVQYFRIVADPTGGNPEDSLKAAWDADIKPELLLALHEDTRLFCQRIKKVAPTEQPEVVFSLDATNIGGITGGEALPASAVMVVSLYSTTYTKRGRGRQFLSGIAEDTEEVGTLGTAQFQALQQHGNNLTSDITEVVNGGTWRNVIFSRDTQAYNDVTAYEARSRVYSHRSRTGRRCASP